MSVKLAVAQASAMESLVTSIRVEHEAAEADARSAVEHAVRCGELLIEAKGQIRHGEWLPWLERNFPADAQTAQRYMRIAANPSRVTHLGSVREALAELAEPRPAPVASEPNPEPADAEVVDAEPVEPDEVLPPAPGSRGRSTPSESDQPAHYLPDVLEGADDDLREQVVVWCSQGRRVDELLDAGCSIAPRFEGDREALLKGLELVEATTKRVMEVLG